MIHPVSVAAVTHSPISSGRPPYPRPAWVQVDIDALASNFRLIRRELPHSVRFLYVLKDDAYGIGAVTAARIGLANGVDELAVYTIGEAVTLRDGGVTAPILLLGERTPEELPWCVSHRLFPCVGNWESASELNALGRRIGRRLAVHLKINTGMNRFGFPWREIPMWSSRLAGCAHLEFAGALSHFAQSDEADKAFALEQLARFRAAITELARAGIRPQRLHMCNSGGFLDLPAAHFDMVRVGILATGVFPSSVCRRLPDLSPVLSLSEGRFYEWH